MSCDHSEVNHGDTLTMLSGAFPQPQVLLIFIGAAVTALTATLVLTPVAEWIGLIDRPGGRKQHPVPTPTIGGLVIYLAILSSMIFLSPETKVVWMMVAVGLLVVTGVLDDAFGLSVKIRLCAQVLASCIMIFGSGLYLKTFGLEIDFFGSAPAGFLVFFTIFALVGLTNGFNMADGIDGLAAGHMLIGLTLVCATMTITSGYIPQIEWFTALFAGVFIFFIINVSLTPLRKVFLGDAGSMLIGFVMGWTLIYCSQEPTAAILPVAALWCVAIPVWDTAIVVARRLKKNQSPFAPDRSHLHHVLIDIGVTSKSALIVILSSSLVISTFGVTLSYLVSSLFSLLVFASILGTLTACIMFPNLLPSLTKVPNLIFRFCTGDKI